MTVYDWAASYTEAQRIEHSFSVRARHLRAVMYAETCTYPMLVAAADELALAVTSDDPDDLLKVNRKLASIGELARFEAEKLEGRA